MTWVDLEDIILREISHVLQDPSHMRSLFLNFFLNFFNLFLRQRETEHERGRGRERGRHRIGSRLQALSHQPRAWADAGLELTDPEIVT